MFLQGSSPITLLLAPLSTYLIPSIMSLGDKLMSLTQVMGGQGRGPPSVSMLPEKQQQSYSMLSVGRGLL